ncbi:MAG: glucokinase [Geminicoccaceae bacterium]
MAMLIADMGGTNARFALALGDGSIQDARNYAAADFPGVLEAAYAFLAGRKVSEAVFAVATPVDDDEILFTNSPWNFSIRALKRELGVEQLKVVNDFVAQARAIPDLRSTDFALIGGGTTREDMPKAVIGPGTGLGVAGLVPSSDGWVVVATEGGHVSFAPADELEIEILQVVRRRYPHVSNERLLSGPGLLVLAEALADIHDAPLAARTPAEVTMAARGMPEGLCAMAVQRFVAMLGGAAGDLALTYGARGGIYVTGGVLQHFGELFDDRLFRQRFVAKGRFRAYLEAIASLRVVRGDTGLIGAAAIARDLQGSQT